MGNNDNVNAQQTSRKMSRGGGLMLGFAAIIVEEAIASAITQWLFEQQERCMRDLLGSSGFLEKKLKYFSYIVGLQKLSRRKQSGYLYVNSLKNESRTFFKAK